MSTIGDRVMALRKSKGLTQGQFGEPVQLAATTISGIEKGKSQSPDTIYAIADYYGAAREWILNGIGKSPDGVIVKEPSVSTDSWKDEAYKLLEAQVQHMKGEIAVYRELLTGPGSRNFLHVPESAGAILVDMYPSGALSGAQVA